VELLRAEDDLEVVGEAVDGTDAVEIAADVQPDVIVMDVRMPLLNGIEATKRIRANQVAPKIVMLTVSDDENDLYASVRAGASGYLIKAVDDIVGAVRAIARGDAVVSSGMTQKLLTEFNVMSRRLEVERDGRALSQRELEVLRLIARGMPNKDIAAELVISQNTVRNHVRNILEKLRVRSRVEAAMYAVREKLVDTP
jgi:DNA-binding NarL/FixJ family response regulator